MEEVAEPEAMIEAARGGRIAHSGFLSPQDSSRLAHQVRQAGVGVTVTGGFASARRRIVTAHPTHVPEAAPALTAVYVAGAAEDPVRRRLRALDVSDTAIGDLVAYRDGVSVVTLDPPPDRLLRGLAPESAAAGPELVPLDRVAGGTVRRDRVVVPSLRVDAIGAKGFRTSRTYFAKGIAAGNVFVNGVRASKGSEAAPGDEIYADGLGWIVVDEIEGETRRGNVKAALTVAVG